MRDIRQFFGLSFHMEPDYDTETIMVSCLGTGYVNVNKVAS